MTAVLLSFLVPILSAGTKCLPIEGKFIVASQVTGIEPAFAALPADAVIAHAPLPGVPRTLSAGELNAVLLRHAAPPTASGGRCFAYFAEPLVPERLMAAFKSSLLARFPESGFWRAELLDHSQSKVPDGVVLYYPISSVAPDRGDGSRLYRGYVAYADDRRFPVWARIRLAVDETRIMATRDLPAGIPMPRDALREERQTVPAPGRGHGVDLDAVTGKVPIRAVRAGTALDPAQLRYAPQVARGDRVRVEVRTGSARLSLAGRAESAGRAGDRIAVFNEASGRRFMATVTSPGSVLVDLNGGRPR